MNITTKEGFKCTVNEEALGDWETVEKLIDVDKGKIQYIREVMTDVIGEDGYEAAKDFVRTDSGRVPTQDLMDLTQSIFNEIRNGGDSKKK